MITANVIVSLTLLQLIIYAACGFDKGGEPHAGRNCESAGMRAGSRGRGLRLCVCCQRPRAGRGGGAEGGGSQAWGRGAPGGRGGGWGGPALAPLWGGRHAGDRENGGGG